MDVESVIVDRKKFGEEKLSIEADLMRLEQAKMELDELRKKQGSIEGRKEDEESGKMEELRQRLQAAMTAEEEARADLEAEMNHRSTLEERLSNLEMEMMNAQSEAQGLREEKGELTLGTFLVRSDRINFLV